MEVRDEVFWKSHYGAFHVVGHTLKVSERLKGRGGGKTEREACGENKGVQQNPEGD